MCPACMASAALIAAGATSGGGFAVWAAKKLVPKAKTKPVEPALYNVRRMK